MHPDLFTIGHFPVKSYGVMLLVGVIVALAIAMRRARRHGVDPEKLWDIPIWVIVPGIVGARVAYIVQEWGYYGQHLNELFSWRLSGLTSFGGVFFGAAGLYVWARHIKSPVSKVLDTVSVPFLVASAIGRVGCLLNGCCYGRETHSALGVRFLDPNGLPLAELHEPAQVYESLLLLVATVGLLLYERGKRPSGLSAALAVGLFGLCRFIYEFWRAGTADQVASGAATSTYLGSLPITQAQVVALALMVVGFGAAVWVARKARTAPTEA